MIKLLFLVEGTINNRLLAAPQRWVSQVSRTQRRWLVIGATLIFCLALPRITPARFWPYLAIVFGGLAALVMVMQWQPLGLVALIITSLLVPSPYLPGGLNVAVVLVGLLGGLWLVGMAIARSFTLAPSRTSKPLLALIAVAGLSFIVGQMPWFGSAPAAPLDTQIGGLALFVLSLAVFWLVANQVRDLRWLQWLSGLFLALAALHILGWILPEVFGPIGSRLQQGATSNSMFWVWTVALSFSQALHNRKMPVFGRLALGALALGTLYVAYVSLDAWKSGYLPILVTMVAIVAARSWRIALLLIVIGLVPARLLVLTAIASDEYSYATRLDAWSVLLSMVKTSPILGFGPANYYWYTPFFQIRGYYGLQFNSHNQYIDIIAQIGLLGLACLVWFVWEVVRLGWQLRARAPEGFARAYVYGALGGLAGTLAAGMLADWFLPFVYNIGLQGFRGSLLAWLFLGGLVSIEQIVRRPAQVQAPA